MSSKYYYAKPKVRKKKNFDKVASVLEIALRKYGLEDKITKYKFVANWPEIIGEAISKRSMPEYIQNKTLYIRVSDSAWVQELSFQKPVIIRRLQKFLEKDTVVRDIRFFVGQI